MQGLVGDNGRIVLQWAVAEPELAKPAVKVLLNLAAIGIDALPRGGQLDIGAERRDGATEIAVRAAGQKIAGEIDGQLRAILFQLLLDRDRGRTR